HLVEHSPHFLADEKAAVGGIGIVGGLDGAFAHVLVQVVRGLQGGVHGPQIGEAVVDVALEAGILVDFGSQSHALRDAHGIVRGLLDALAGGQLLLDVLQLAVVLEKPFQYAIAYLSKAYACRHGPLLKSPSIHRSSTRWSGCTWPRPG